MARSFLPWMTSSSSDRLVDFINLSKSIIIIIEIYMASQILEEVVIWSLFSLSSLEICGVLIVSLRDLIKSTQ